MDVYVNMNWLASLVSAATHSDVCRSVSVRMKTNQSECVCVCTNKRDTHTEWAKKTNRSQVFLWCRVHHSSVMLFYIFFPFIPVLIQFAGDSLWSTTLWSEHFVRFAFVWMENMIICICLCGKQRQQSVGISLGVDDKTKHIIQCAISHSLTHFMAGRNGAARAHAHIRKHYFMWQRCSNKRTHWKKNNHTHTHSGA